MQMQILYAHVPIVAENIDKLLHFYIWVSNCASIHVTDLYLSGFGSSDLD